MSGIKVSTFQRSGISTLALYHQQSHSTFFLQTELIQVRLPFWLLWKLHSMKITNPAIPFDSVVVVIGANGYMGLETCEKLLQAGFRVRGTVRNVAKYLWMIELFDKKWPGKFQLTKVEDFEAEGAFDVAFKGRISISLREGQTPA